MRSDPRTALGVLLCAAVVACGDSKELLEIQAACEDSGKFDVKMCRCIAEGAEEAEMSATARRWLVAQLAAPADTAILVGVEPTLKTRDYVRYVNRIVDPSLFCANRAS